MPDTKRTLRELREEKGLRREQVAGEIGWSLRTVWRHEDGTTALKPYHRKAYADLYGVTPEEIAA